MKLSEIELNWIEILFFIHSNTRKEASKWAKVIYWPVSWTSIKEGTWESSQALKQTRGIVSC